MYDFLIVGSGLFGAVFAQQCHERSLSCLVVDKNDHIAGNCYTVRMHDIDVHMYGPHIFATNNRAVWGYAQRFSAFRPYTHRVKANYRGRIYSLPINLMTLQQVYGVTTPAEAERKLAEVRVSIAAPRNMEEWCLSQIGPDLYEMFFRHYTEKQWGCSPQELGAEIGKRLPIRLTYDDRYHDCYWSGIPEGGYTDWIGNMLSGVRVELQTDFRHMDWRKYARRLVYSGRLDELFGCCHGPLGYRSLRFEHEVHAGDWQGVAQMNYTDSSVPWTRITEHKHFNVQRRAMTVISKEYPSAGGDPYYPKGSDLVAKYRSMIQDDMIVGGRLGSHRYMNMDAVVAQALKLFRRAVTG